MSIRITAEEARLRKEKEEMMRKWNNPEKVRAWLRSQNYTDESIDKEMNYEPISSGGTDATGEKKINTSGMTETAKAIAEGRLDYTAFKKGSTPTEVGVVREQLLKAGVDISAKEEGPEAIGDPKEHIYNFDQSTIETDGAKQSYNYGTRMMQSDEVLSEFEASVAGKGGWEGFKQFIDEMQAGHTLTQRFVPEEFQKVDQAQRNFINATLRRESGAVINPDEFENARKQYFPVPGDGESTLEQKRQNREQIVKNFLGQAGIGAEIVERAISGEEAPKDDTPGEEATPDQPQRAKHKIAGQEMNDEEALAWAKQNPNSAQAKFIVSKIGQQETPSLSEETTPPPQEQAGEGREEEKKDSFLAVPEWLDNIMTKASDFLGQTKFAEGVGLKIYFTATPEGRQLIKDAEEGDEAAKARLAELKEASPNAKEFWGSAAMTGLNLVSGGSGGGLVKATTTAQKVSKGVAIGTAYGTASGMEQDKDAAGIAKEGALSGFLGGAITFGGLKWSKWREAKRVTRSQELQDVAGQITQGKKGDKAVAFKTLTEIDTNDVKTYEELVKKYDDNIAALGDSMDEVLGKDTSLTKIDELVVKTKVGKKTVKTNYVNQAMDDLDKLYTQTASPAEAERISQLRFKATKKGLTVKELNDLAIEYGINRNGFTRAGELSTGVNRQGYENVRKGIKTTLRSKLPNDTAKNIDKAFSENFKARDLLVKMEEKVNALSQKVNKRSLSEKAGRLIGKAWEKVPIAGGGTRGVVNALVHSNAGNKSMNALALEEQLAKNLAFLEKDGEKFMSRLLDKVPAGGLNELLSTSRGQAIFQTLLRNMTK